MTSIPDAVRREAVQKLLARMFPILSQVWDDLHVYASVSEPELTRQMHVASSAHFDAYFRLSLPPGPVGRVEASRLLALAAIDPNTLKGQLREMAGVRKVGGSSRVPSLLQTFRSMPEEAIQHGAVKSLIEAFLDVGDELWQPGDQPVFVWSMGNNIEMAALVRSLLKRVASAERFPLLQSATRTGAAVCMPIYLVQSLREAAQSRLKAEGEAADVLVSESQLSDLDKDVLAKIEAKARDFSLLNVPDLKLAFNYWRFLVQPDERPFQWLRTVVEDDDRVVKFLAKSLSKGFRLPDGSRVREPHNRLDPEQLKEFLPPDESIDRIRQLAATGRYAGDEQLALDTYIQEFDMRKQGLSPDDPLDRMRFRYGQSGGAEPPAPATPDEGPPI